METIWATIDIGQQQLLIYHQQQPQEKPMVIAQFPYPLLEKSSHLLQSGNERQFPFGRNLNYKIVKVLAMC